MKNTMKFRSSKPLEQFIRYPECVIKLSPVKFRSSKPLEQFIRYLESVVKLSPECSFYSIKHLANVHETKQKYLFSLKL